MNAMGFLVNSLGNLMGFIVALFLDFQMQALSAISIPILFAFVFYFVPESPFFLYKNNKIEVSDDGTGMALYFCSNKHKLLFFHINS